MDGWSEISGWSPDGGSGSNFGWEFWNSPLLGELEGFLVGKREMDVRSETDRDVVRWSKRGCPSVKWTGTGLVNVWTGCKVVPVDGQLPRGAKTKAVYSYAPICPY